jgi:hypothetical protein
MDKALSRDGALEENCAGLWERAIKSKANTAIVLDRGIRQNLPNLMEEPPQQF